VRWEVKYSFDEKAQAEREREREREQTRSAAHWAVKGRLVDTRLDLGLSAGAK
jgi:hypothetical protein